MGRIARSIALIALACALSAAGCQSPLIPREADDHPAGSGALVLGDFVFTPSIDTTGAKPRMFLHLDYSPGSHFDDPPMLWDIHAIVCYESGGQRTYWPLKLDHAGKSADISVLAFAERGSCDVWGELSDVIDPKHLSAITITCRKNSGELNLTGAQLAAARRIAKAVAPQADDWVNLNSAAYSTGWEPFVGRRVLLSGTPLNAKGGAIVSFGGNDVYLRDLHEWPADAQGKRVGVTGILRVSVGVLPEGTAGIAGAYYWIEKPEWALTQDEKK